MAFDAFTFSFAKSAGPFIGDQVIIPGGGSGIPFEPKAFMFMSFGGTTNGVFTIGDTRSATHQKRWLAHGMAVPPGVGSVNAPGIDQVSRCCHSGVSAGFFGIPSVDHGGAYDENSCIMFFDGMGGFGTGLMSSRGALKSVDNIGGGFWGITIDWLENRADDPARIIHCTAFDGDVVMYHWGVNSITGTQVKTGVGRKSDVVLTMGGDTAPGPGPTLGPGYHHVISAMNCQLEQVGISIAPSNGAGNLVGIREHNIIAALPVTADETHMATITLASMDADGWTINIVSPSATAYGYGLHSLCFTGVGSKIGSFIKPVVTTGPQVVPTPSHTPKFAWFFGDNNTALTGLQNNDRIAIGYATAITQGAGAGSSIRIPGTPFGSPVSGVDFDNKAFVVVNNDTETIQGRIGSVAFSGGQFTADWDINDTEETEILFATLGTGRAGKCEAGGMRAWGYII